MALTAKFTKQLGNFHLRVDLTAENGAPLALLGASGSGKSLTLRCIAGVLRPDSGRIVLDNTVLFDSEKHIDLPPQRRGVGFLFQQYALFPHMTVRQNIAAGAHALKGADRERRVSELLERFRLSSLADSAPAQLSGGEQQRTALARMLAASPRVILLDEPLSALDSFLRWRLELELQEMLAGFDGPAIWVSHDRGEAYRSCHTVCVMENGASSPVRSMKETLADPLTVGAARLFGCKNFAPVRPGPASGLVEVPAWGLALRAAAPWRETVTTLGIPSASLHPAKAGEENAFPCEAVRVTEDVAAMIVLLRPLAAAAEAPLLRMELDKSLWAAVPDQKRLTVAVRPEEILLLEG